MNDDQLNTVWLFVCFLFICLSVAALADAWAFREHTQAIKDLKANCPLYAGLHYQQFENFTGYVMIPVCNGVVVNESEKCTGFPRSVFPR